MNGRVEKIRRKSGDRWRVVIDLGRDPKTGKFVRHVPSGTYEKKSLASAAMRQALDEIEMNNGQPRRTGRMTLSAYLLDVWLPAHRSQVRKSTLEQYRALINGYVVRRLGAADLETVSGQNLTALYAELEESGRREGQPLSPKTVRNVHLVLHKALAEVRVFPNEQEPTGTERGLGQWSEADESVPTNGVPSRLMRNVSPRVAHEVGHKILQQVARERGDNFATTAKALRIDPATIKLPPTPPAGRRRLPERQLAQLAARYVDARLSGSPSPVKDVAEQLSEKPEWVSGRVHTARVRGLLTRTAKGRPGGALTERAEELLKGQP